MGYDLGYAMVCVKGTLYGMGYGLVYEIPYGTAYERGYAMAFETA